MSAFCEPETTTSRSQASASQGRAPRLETASTTTSAPASLAAAAGAPPAALLGGRGERTHVCDDAGGGLGLHDPDRLRLLLAQARPDVVRVGRLPPGVAKHVHLSSEGGGHRDPALAEAT